MKYACNGLNSWRLEKQRNPSLNKMVMLASYCALILWWKMCVQRWSSYVYDSLAPVCKNAKWGTTSTTPRQVKIQIVQLIGKWWTVSNEQIKWSNNSKMNSILTANRCPQKIQKTQKKAENSFKDDSCTSSGHTRICEIRRVMLIENMYTRILYLAPRWQRPNSPITPN